MKIFYSVLAFSAALLLSGCGSFNRLSALDEKENGFAIYRSGQPKDADLEEWCKLGITRIFALNGQAGQYEQKLKEKCPTANVVFNQEQNPDLALPAEFLEFFDRSVVEAQASGERIMFHCYCGCHRTGRLAAYYRMKYQNFSSDQAIEEMLAVGKDMDSHKSLGPQVLAMEDYIRGRSCRQSAELCIRQRVALTASQEDTDTNSHETFPLSYPGPADRFR